MKLDFGKLSSILIIINTIFLLVILGKEFKFRKDKISKTKNLSFGTPNIENIDLSSIVKGNHQDLIKLIRFLKQSKKGKRLIKLFEKEYSSGKIQLMFNKNPFVFSNQLATVGNFFFDGRKKYIFLLAGEEFGMTALTLIHEIAHAYDKGFLDSFAYCLAKRNTWKNYFGSLTRETLNVAAKIKKGPGNINWNSSNMINIRRKMKLHVRSEKELLKFIQIRRLRTERMAYDFEHDVRNELMNVNRELKEYFVEKINKGLIEKSAKSNSSLIRDLKLNEIRDLF